MRRGYQLDPIPQAVSAPSTAAETRGNVTCFPKRAKVILMKTVTLLGAIALLATALGAESLAPSDQQQVETALKEVQDQQLQIAENQVKIDAKLATVAEAVRVARIYSSRGGR